MSRRLTERIEIARVVDADCSGDFRPLDDFISELMQIREQQPPEIRPLLMLSSRVFGDYAYAFLTIEYDKTETDAEYQARLAEEELEKRKRAEKLMRDERRLYERLKEKYS